MPCFSLLVSHIGGERVDVHNLGPLGAQKELVKIIIATRAPNTDFIAEKPVTEESISNSTL